MATHELAADEEASLRPAHGSVRSCLPYRGELTRHRLISADGGDYIVATLIKQGRRPGYLTGAYPVTRGYLVMMRQPLYEIHSTEEAEARSQHERLVKVLAEAGVSIVRAERMLAARQRAEKQEAAVATGHLPADTSDTQKLLKVVSVAAGSQRANLADREDLADAVI